TEGRDKVRAAARKNKRSKSSASSSVNEDALARLMITEMNCREQDIEQQDMRLYLQPYDHLTGDQRKAMDAVRARIKAKYNLEY
ncbi:hypothetical protein Tco_0229208, partial [Tanacetum coccineum]